MSDYNNCISKEEMIGKFALNSKNGLTQDDVELAGMLADFHNKAYDGGYRVGQEEAKERNWFRFQRTHLFSKIGKSWACRFTTATVKRWCRAVMLQETLKKNIRTSCKLFKI